MGDRKPAFLLPAVPHGLCFSTEHFTSDNFSVDKFVSDRRKQVQLETLCEDLGVYLRVLSSAVVELINQDYADFVNVSTNLVGLDKSIENVALPLKQVHDEVQAVKSAITEVLSDTEMGFKEKRNLEKHKTRSSDLLEVMTRAEHMEAYVVDVQTDTQSKGRQLERLATEFIALTFLMERNESLQFAESMRIRLSQVNCILSENLEKELLNGILTHEEAAIGQCLRIYCLIDATSKAEEVVACELCQPYMLEVISKECQPNGNELEETLSKVLEFVPKYCSELTALTRGESGIPGYNFLVSAVFPAMVTRLEDRIESLFSINNPNHFHHKYTKCMDFVRKFESECKSDECISALHNSPSYRRFLDKWNVAVYFQIRLQEIAGKLEQCLGEILPYVEDIKRNEESPFLLPATQMLWSCVHKCWDPDIYLDVLLARFWKLTLLLLARYTYWCTTMFVSESEDSISSAGYNNDSTCDNHSNDSNDAVSTSDTNDSSSLLSQSFTNSSETIGTATKVALIGDICKLKTEVPALALTRIMPFVVSIKFPNPEYITEALQDSLESFDGILPGLCQKVTDSLTKQCIARLQLVHDIPRLYRRTNREVPIKPYVKDILQPLQCLTCFGEDATLCCYKQEWMLKVTQAVTDRYYQLTSDVLMSVKKMEDSLKRLKKAVDKPVMSANVSDDDKIRTQFALDVHAYRNEVVSLGLTKEDVVSIHRLLNLVDMTRISPEKT